MPALYVDRHGARLGHRANRLTVTQADGSEAECAIEQLARVVVCGQVHFSYDAIAALLRHEVPTVISRPGGGLAGTLSTGCGRQIGRRLRQMDAVRDTRKSLEVALALIQAKMRGHGRLLGHWGVPGRAEIARELRAARHCPEVSSLRGHEGDAAVTFFAGLRKHLEGTGFTFVARRRHQPPDPVNASLSLGYTLLSAEVEAGIASYGLEPCAGFLHATQDGRMALVFDLVEPLRPLVDRWIARILRHELAPEDFENGDNGCRVRDGSMAGWIARASGTSTTKVSGVIHFEGLNCVSLLPGVRPANAGFSPRCKPLSGMEKLDADSEPSEFERGLCDLHHDAPRKPHAA